MSSRETFEAMLANGQDNTLLRYSLGNACMAEQLTDQAIVHFKKALEMDGDYSAAWKLLGKCYDNSAEYQLAVDAWTAGIAAAEKKGDKQALKEMQVFVKRARKKLE